MAWFDNVRHGVSAWFSNPWPEGKATVPVSSFSASPKPEPVTSAPEISSTDETSEYNARAHDVLQCSPKSKYSIFLSHSGAQKAFVDQLYIDFTYENQFPFFDSAPECLKRGEEFSSLILKAAKECEVAIFIVTEQFLTSKWPMLELLTCIEAQKKSNPGLKLFPVLFDGLEYKDLQEFSRWEKTWETLDKLTQERSVKITVENCKEAVRKLRSILGLDFKRFPGLERKLRKVIVKDTLKLMALTPDIDIEDIQGVDRLCKELSEMFQESAMHNKGVQYLGLYGMGGLGKTTMCKALYCHFWSKFSQKACIVDLGIAPRKLERQQDLLSRFTTLSKRAKRNIKDNDAAKKYLKEHLKDVPVFLAVDNVQDDEASRQEARDYLKFVCCEGSIVLITSRSRVILEDVLSDPECCKPVPTLTKDESMELFLQIAIPKMKLRSFDKEQVQILRKICTRHCFFSVQESSSSGIGELVFKDDRPMFVIKPGEEGNGHYHPLAIRAVASFLHDRFLKKESVRWNGNIMLPHSREDIFSILALGFDSLSPKVKQLFIDVALYAPPLRPEDKLYDWLLAVHGGSDGVVMAELSKLDRKCFLSFKFNRINIHDLYKKFGKKYIKEHQDFEFGIYHKDADIVTGPDWSNVPRVSLKSCKLAHPQKLESLTWTNVVVVHLVCCEGLHSFPIGDLVKLKHLMIINCLQLEVISWMHHRVRNDWKEFVPEGQTQLRFVELLCNWSLRSIPDFSKCSNLKSLHVVGSLVESVNLTSCTALEHLQFGKLQQSPNLESAPMAWNFGEDIPKLKLKPKPLKIIGPEPPNSIKQRPHAMSSEEVFRHQYPEAMEVLPSLKIGNLQKLHTLCLQQLPMGKLPAGFETWGSNLLNLNLSGSLLSQLVNFSTFSNLQKLNIAGTNVKEVRGIDRLTKIESLDFSYCFRLQKIPDLRRLSKLERLCLLYCTRLKAVPRVPPEYHRGDEFETRFALGLSTGLEPRSHMEFLAKLSEFRSRRRGSKTSPAESALHSTEAIHRGVECDGCGQLPLRGPRFKAKEKTFNTKFCSACFTDRCDTSKCQATRRSRIVASEFNVDLCLTCFTKFGGNAEDFMCIDKTER